MNLTPVQKAFLALIVANTIWGAASPIFKLSLQNIPPFTLAFWRFLPAALLLGIFLKGHVGLSLGSRKDFFLFLTNAFMGITINIIFFFWGLALTHAINAPIIASGGPIVVFFLAVLFLHESFSLKKFLGMLLGTAGIILIIFEPILTTGVDGSVLGNFFLVLATVGAVVATLAGRSVFQRHDPMVLTFWAFLVGAVSFLPLAVWEYLKDPTIYVHLDWRGLLGIGFGAVLSSAAAYTLFNWGLSKISASDTSMFSYIDPIVGTILSFFLLHEPISIYFLIGSAAIFGGIGLAEGRLHWHPINKLRGQKNVSTQQLRQEKETALVDRSEVLRKIFKSDKIA